MMQNEREDADYGRARALFEAGSHKEALELYMALAERPNVSGTLLAFIGMMFRNGLGTPRNQDEALKWYERAADAGDPAAMVYLGQVDLKAGRRATARKRFERAEEQEYALASYQLAAMDVVHGDLEKARQRLERLASQDYSPAMYMLGRWYQEGVGVAVNGHIAQRYFEEAAKLGHVFAQRKVAQKLLKGSNGLPGVITGARMFVRAISDAARIGWRDPSDDRIRT